MIENEIITKPILSYIVNNLPAFTSNQIVYSKWKNFWLKKISNISDELIAFKTTASNTSEMFSLPYQICDNKISIRFNIDKLNQSIDKGELFIQTTSLSEFKNSIWYSKIENCILSPNYKDSRILGIYFPNNIYTTMKPVCIIDGNHRINAAIKSNTDIEITFIQNQFFDMKYFMTLNDFIAFHILFGYLYLKFNNLQNCLRYINDLYKYE